MADEPIEVAIEAALLMRLTAHCETYGIEMAAPGRNFKEPSPAPGKYWLRPSFLPNDTDTLAIGFSSGSNMHYGIFQIDVFYVADAGELAPGRVAASLIQLFKFGTRLTAGAFVVQVLRAPYRSAMTPQLPWVQLPVRVPYTAFADNP